MFPIEDLQIDRKLDLSVQKDRATLIRAVRGIPVLENAIVAGLADYRRLLPKRPWRIIYPGGLVVAAQGRRGRTLSLVEGMSLARALAKLETLPGFDELMKQVNNPEQVASAVFEAQAAAWCVGRRLTTSLELQPSLAIGDGRWTPDFSWGTTHGQLLCECKRMDRFESKPATRLQRFVKEFARAYETYPEWDASWRLDIQLVASTMNRAANYIEALTSRAHEADRGRQHSTWSYGCEYLTARFHQRSEAPSLPESTLVGGVTAVGESPVPVVLEAGFSVALPIGGHRLRALTALIREARRQLSRSSVPGAVFVEVPTSSGVERKLSQLVSQGEYASTPMLFAWRESMPLIAVWRANQPFDGSLLADRQ